MPRTLDYLEHVAGLVLNETGLLPHINAGMLTGEDFRALARGVARRLGIMLETASERLVRTWRAAFRFARQARQRAPRLARAAGEARVPFTSGILIGIGETPRTNGSTRCSRSATCTVEHGHMQEIIVQNFLPKAGTQMATRRAGGSTNCSGPSPWRGSCSVTT